MQVICPNCGEKVTADHINIQKMTAVCGSCDTVFLIEAPVPKTKAKRRNIKQPKNLMLRDADTLRMEFRTNFRLEQNESFMPVALMGTILTIVGFILLGEEDGVPLLLPIAFLGAAIGLWYFAALTAVNKTHIEMDDDTIRVMRKPLPNPLSQANEVSLTDVEAIRCEETEISKKEEYDTPRYRVWAETEDGTRRTIVNDLTEDYAVYVAQRLNERLQANDDYDESRLAESSAILDEYSDGEANLNEMMRENRRQSAG